MVDGYEAAYQQAIAERMSLNGHLTKPALPV
jgi:hypothetical protein